MERLLRQHLAYLEQRIRELGQEITQNRLSATQRNRREDEIRAAETALD